MNIKSEAKEARNSLQQGIYAVINPFVRLMIRMGVTPNMVTTVGLLGNIAAACDSSFKLSQTYHLFGISLNHCQCNYTIIYYCYCIYFIIKLSTFQVLFCNFY